MGKSGRELPPLAVAFVSSELHPYSKTGGLADVSGALPPALARLGCAVRSYSPLYRGARERLSVENAPTSRIELPHGIWIDGQLMPVAYVSVWKDGVELVFVECDPAFDRAGMYVDEQRADYPDNVARFSLFCRAIIEHFLFAGAPQVLHCNDWQTALLPLYLKRQYPQPELAGIVTLLSIHNMGYQGVFPSDALFSAGLGWEDFTVEGLEYWGKVNLLKGGIVHADAISTVSPTYAREIQKAEYGCGLEGLLQASRARLSGILNGIDTAEWDPATDALLGANYSARQPRAKAECKRLLQQRLGLPERKGALLLAMITRLDVQKGVDLLIEAWPQLERLDLQLVVLGSGNPGIEEALSELAVREPQRVALHLGFNEELAHQIYAGADALLMPSVYEPCGLNQMYAQRYGTVPIVRQTGGLRDTVSNATAARIEDGSASGFSFKALKPARLAEAIRAAAKLFSHRRQWTRLRALIMRLDHSWDSSAREYLKLYGRLLRRRHKAQGRAAEPAAKHRTGEQAHG